MLQVIIISQNQKEFIAPFKSFLDSNLPGCPALIVLDRCTDGSEAEAERVCLPYVVNRTGEGQLHGMLRDIGLARVGCSDTLFLDGDRIPKDAFDLDFALYALASFDLSVFPISEHEPRVWFHPKFIVKNPAYGTWRNGIYGCGFIMRGPAIRAIMNLNGGTLFNPKLSGVYGADDLYLGDVAYSLGLTCGALPLTMALSGGGFTPRDRRGPGFKRGMMARYRLRKSLTTKENSDG